MKIAIADNRSDLNALAALFSRNLTPEYISHGELQGRRALGPRQWAPDIENVLRQEILQRLREPLSEFPNSGNWQGVVEIYTNSNLVGVAFVTISHDAAVPFGIIEDIVIEKSARSEGLGTSAMQWILDQFKKVGLRHAFLESGLRNESAHHLFEKLGFQTTSIVMMRDL